MQHRTITHLALVAVVALAAAGPNAVAQDYSSRVTTPMDENGLAWYEQGLNSAAPASGLPHPGIIPAQDDPSSTFLLQPYTGNNVLLLSLNTKYLFGGPPVSTGTMTLTTPTLASQLAFATAGADGEAISNLVIHFSDGTPDVTASIASPDWTNGGGPRNPPVPVIAQTSGRLSVDPGMNSFFLNEPGDNAQILEEVVTLPSQVPHPVSSIDFTVTTPPSFGIAPTAAFFGVSTGLGVANPFTAAPLTASSFNADVVVETPEPASLGLLLLVGTGLSCRRGRRKLLAG
jgi:hypothetical protein